MKRLPTAVCLIAAGPVAKWNEAGAQRSREAAQECSPGREPWVVSGTGASPAGAKEKLRHRSDRHGTEATTQPLAASRKHD